MYDAEVDICLQRSTISDLLKILQDVFSREPPVVAKQDQETQASLRVENAPPVPPLPSELSHPISSNSSSFPQARSTPQSPPPPPPKPFLARSGRTEETLPPLQADLRYSQGDLNSHTLDRNNVWKMPEPSNVNIQRLQLQQDQQYLPSPTNQSQDHRHLSAISFPSESNSPTFSPSSINGDNRYSQVLRASDTAQSSRPQLRVGSPQAHLPHQSHLALHDRPSFQSVVQPQVQSFDPHLSNQIYSGPSASTQIPRKKPPEDLLTSPFDTPLPTNPIIAAPPVPPNPEKDALLYTISRTLTTQIHQTISTHASALQPLAAQHTALLNAQHALQQEKAALTTLRSQLDESERILHAAMHDADRCVADARRRKIPGVDEVLVAPTVVGEQLYTLAAEERACLEAREVLGRALDKGRVGVEGWVKNVRGLAREEFLKKALARKCAQGMGLVVGNEENRGRAA